jgi:hypothetical protein
VAELGQPTLRFGAAQALQGEGRGVMGIHSLRA